MTAMLRNFLEGVHWSSGIALLFVSCFITSEVGFAQPSTQSNFGKEFYLAFPEVLPTFDGASKTLRTFVLYIASKTSASGTVDIPAVGFSQAFTASPGTITAINVPSNPKGFSVELYESEVVFPGFGVHITADQDIEVFVLSHLIATSDAYTPLPVPATGTDYSTINYPSAQFNNLRTGIESDRSEFTLVGEFDSTTVTIVPKSKTAMGKVAGRAFSILLNRDDAYMVQGDSLLGNDLTGSSIESNKPVAVITGDEDTPVPEGALNDSGYLAKWNQLLEELPPISAWGCSAIVVPFRSSEKPDLVRVLSAADNNAITISGALAATINKGQFYEITSIPGPLVITASGPILVGQYSHSDWDVASGYGDPSLVLDYPVEQYDTAYEIEAITTPTIDNGQDNHPAFDSSFVNITIDTSGIASLRMDGAPMAGNLFSTIAGSRFSFAQILVTPGAHHFNGSVTFGLTVYGFGSYDAYSYPGGAEFHDLEPATLRVVPFNTTLLCHPEDRAILVENPGDEPSQLSAVSLNGASPSPFSVTTQLPVTIPPGDSVPIVIHFAPSGAGSYSAIVTLSFDEPRNQSYQVPIMAIATPSPILALHSCYPFQPVDFNEPFYIPILVDSAFLSSGASSATVVLTHTPRLFTLGDVVSANTLSSGGYVSYTSSPTADTIKIQFKSPLTAAIQSSSGALPLVLLKLDPISSLERPASRDTSSLSAFLSFSGSDCYTMQASHIEVIIGAECYPPVLSNDSLLTSVSAMDLPFPNPASQSLEIPIVIGVADVVEGLNSAIEIQILNMMGVTIRSQTIPGIHAGRTSVSVDVSTLRAGEYFVRARIDNSVLVRPFVHR